MLNSVFRLQPHFSLPSSVTICTLYTLWIVTGLYLLTVLVSRYCLDVGCMMVQRSMRHQREYQAPPKTSCYHTWCWLLHKQIFLLLDFGNGLSTAINFCAFMNHNHFCRMYSLRNYVCVQNPGASESGWCRGPDVCSWCGSDARYRPQQGAAFRGVQVINREEILHHWLRSSL